jgi:rod shape determining protein RodA
MRKSQSITNGVDWVLLGAVILLMALGVATVYSTAFDPEHPSIFDFSQVYGKQIVWILISLFLGILVFLIDSEIYRKFALPIFISSMLLLVIVLFMPAKNGARAWLGIGSLGIQPGEFAKIAAAILLARYLADFNQKLQTIRNVLLANTIILVPMVLILLQPDAGTFVVFTSFLFVMYREGVTYDPLVLKAVNLLPGVKFKQTWVGVHFIPILFVVVFLSIATLLVSNETITVDMFPGTTFSGYWGVFVFLFIFSLVFFFVLRLLLSKRDKKRAIIIATIGFILAVSITKTVDFGFQKLAPHQKERIELFLGLTDNERAKDGVDYNRNRAITAVGSGGFSGKGYMNGVLANVRSNHVPESETDFIFCPFAEEWGFIGTSFLISLYLFILLRIVVIAERQRSTFNRVYAYSVAMILFYHFGINIGMSIEFAPVIGIPLPFFSYGGSSMMSFSIMMFILLKLDSQRKDVLN